MTHWSLIDTLIAVGLDSISLELAVQVASQLTVTELVPTATIASIERFNKS
jgi:hypothetical protein